MPAQTTAPATKLLSVKLAMEANDKTGMRWNGSLMTLLNHGFNSSAINYKTIYNISALHNLYKYVIFSYNDYFMFFF